MTFIHNENSNDNDREARKLATLRKLTRQAALPRRPDTFALNEALASAWGATEEEIAEAIRQHPLHHHRLLIESLPSGIGEISLDDLSYIFNEINGKLIVDVSTVDTGDRVEFRVNFGYSLSKKTLGL